MNRSWVLSLFLCVTLIAAGCTGSGGSGSSGGGQSQNEGTTPTAAPKPAQSPSGTAAPAPEQPQGLPMVNGKYDPPVTITTVRGVVATVKFRQGESIDDNVMSRWAEERLGIQIKNLWSVVDTNNAFATKLRLALASNEPLPDVIYIGGTNRRSCTT